MRESCESCALCLDKLHKIWYSVAIISTIYSRKGGGSGRFAHEEWKCGKGVVEGMCKTLVGRGLREGVISSGNGNWGRELLIWGDGAGMMRMASEKTTGKQVA